MSRGKPFFIGLSAGVALALVVLQMWGKYLDRAVVLNANPWLIQPLQRGSLPKMPKSSDMLPRPVLPTATGAAHDQWTIHSLGGKAVALGDFRGKVVFLNFWSTSCGPCIVEMPGIERLQDSLRNEPVAFLAVTRDDEHSVRAFLQKVPFRLPIYLAGDDTPEDFGPQLVPRTFILSRTGRQVFRGMGGLNWDDQDARQFLRGLEAQ